MADSISPQQLRWIARNTASTSRPPTRKRISLRKRALPNPSSVSGGIPSLSWRKRDACIANRRPCRFCAGSCRSPGKVGARSAARVMDVFFCRPQFPAKQEDKTRHSRRPVHRALLRGVHDDQLHAGKDLIDADSEMSEADIQIQGIDGIIKGTGGGRISHQMRGGVAGDGANHIILGVIRIEVPRPCSSARSLPLPQN